MILPLIFLNVTNKNRRLYTEKSIADVLKSEDYYCIYENTFGYDKPLLENIIGTVSEFQVKDEILWGKTEFVDRCSDYIIESIANETLVVSTIGKGIVDEHGVIHDYKLECFNVISAEDSSFS